LGSPGGYEVELIHSVELSTWIPVLAADPSFLESFVARFWNYFQVALGLGFVIFIHELGHFLAAKFFGVKCEKFYVGFDVPISIGPIKLPRTLGKFQWGETEYGIGIIPLGGYVKMLGQDDDPRNAQSENDRIKVTRDDSEAPTVAPKLDPRSYPAKPVYARMIIISAGVVMNLISAVFMAAIAYSIGVPYTPTVVGQVVGGSPAWENGLQPGDYIVQVGNMTEPNKQMDFREMSALIATEGLQDEAASIPITVEANQTTKQLAFPGTKQFSPKGKFVSLGVTSANLAAVSKGEPVAPFANSQISAVDLKSGDKFISINGQTLPLFSEFGEALSFEVNRQFQAAFYKPVDVVVERKEGETTKQLTLTIPPNPMRTFGLGFKPSPIRRIAKNSLAMLAGVQVGDSLVAVNDEPVVDGWTLPIVIARKGAEAEVKLTFQRGNKEVTPATYVLTLQPFTPSFDIIAPVGGMLTIKHLGVAYDLEPEVSYIEPNSPAAAAGVQVGDVLGKLKLKPNAEYADKISTRDGENTLTIGEDASTVTVMDSLQSLPVDLEIILFLTRNGVVQEATVKTQESSQYFWYTRGISMQPLSREIVATSASQAFGFGLKETWRRLGEVVNFLRMLVTGRVPVDLLGGPLRIAQAASMQAEQGPSTLLIFLTLLSANLAVVNFLPIPALDGGHIMFLTAEAASGKPVNETWQIRLTIAGVLALLCLMAFVILNDIVQMVLWS
jgi:regulator of sigma E protease